MVLRPQRTCPAGARRQSQRELGPPGDITKATSRKDGFFLRSSAGDRRVPGEETREYGERKCRLDDEGPRTERRASPENGARFPCRHMLEWSWPRPRPSIQGHFSMSVQLLGFDRDNAARRRGSLALTETRECFVDNK